jgi:hypothetical protein
MHGIRSVLYFFILNSHNFVYRFMQKASRSCSDLESAEFWSLLAFPMALLMWCANILASLLQPIIDKTHQVRGPLRYERPHSSMD